MRAGVSTVQQTLTPEAANVLRHAIADAQRRGHAQVTPLHVASTLLTASGSLLRQACIQSHVDSPDAPQVRSLELCFNVALERLATLQGSHVSSAQPSLSNALIAALKRAQAHQRRGYPEQQQVPLLAVKVEMEQLIISILDDPSVSRVMREASFSSTQIKNCLEEAMGSTPQTQQQSRIGSVNMDRLRLKLGSGEHMGFNLAGFGSPFRHGSSIHAGAADPRLLGYATSFEREKFPGLQFGMPERNFKPLNFLSRGQDLEPATFNAQDMKNVIDILLKSKKRNPVLIGERTLGTSLSKELMQRLDKSDVPEVLHGVKLLLYNLSFMSNFHSKEEINQKMKELGKAVEDCMPTGAIVFLGDLQWLVQKPLPQSGCFTLSSCTPTQHLVSELGKLYAAHEASRRLWFVGVASSQTYLHCQTWHPSLESEWDLQPVHTATILNLRARFGIHASETMARATPCKQTALDEAVFFCADCKAKCEEEEHNLLQETEGTDAIAKEGAKEDIPFWLKERKEFAYQQNELSKKDRTHVEKVQEIQRKWSQHCQTLHKQSRLPGVVNVFDKGTSLTQPPPVLCTNGKASKGLLSQSVVTSSMPTWLMLHSKSVPSCPVSLSSTTSSIGSMRVHDQILTNNVEIGSSGSSAQASISVEDKVSLKLSPPSFDGKPSSLPVQTDLVLGRSNEKNFGDTNVIREDYWLNLHKERVKDVPACTSSMQELLFPSISSVTAQSPSVMDPRPVNRGENDAHLYIDPSSFKDLCKKLSERVPWQKEAIGHIASTVMGCRSGLGRRRGLSMKGDTWLLLLGPDLIGKQQIAKGIAESLFGCSKKVVSLSLKTEHGMHFIDEGGNTACRGKTHLDMVVEAVRRDPSSVILIEDIDNADRITKNTLFRAMERGRLAGLNGREVSLSNSVIIMASNRGVSTLTKRDRRIAGLDENGLINLRRTGLKLLLDKATDSASCVHVNGPVSITECSKETNPGGKRKFDWEDDVSHHQAAEKRNKCETRGMDLDLNLSLDQSQTSLNCSSESDIDALKVFAEEFLPRDFCKLIDEIIMFQPFDFDGLVDRILESIASVVKSKEVSIEIDVQVLQQLVSIVWKASLQQDVLDKWSEQVLGDAVSKLLGEKTPTDLVVKLVAVGKDGKEPTSDMDLLLLPKEIELEM